MSSAGHVARNAESPRLATTWQHAHRRVLLAILGAAVACSAIAPFDRRDWLVEHAPTAGTIAFLVWYERRRGGRPLSNVAYTLVWAFLMLHVVGAHHLYSRVPYEHWFTELFGRPWPWPSARNHYDRFVHGAFGMLALPPFAELAERHVVRSRGWAIAVAIAAIVAGGTLYELVEWCIAAIAPGAVAEAYNGQQGDPFDAQRDMALGLGGALASAALLLWLPRPHPQ
jgi:putative membrane protein